ncbi:MAG: DUF6702 family protein [Bacteroidota bacterium]
MASNIWKTLSIGTSARSGNLRIVNCCQIHWPSLSRFKLVAQSISLFQMFIKHLLLTMLISGHLLAADHPLKMSFSKLTLSSNGLVELETRIFLDDLTEHMQKAYQLSNPDFSGVNTSGTQALQRYLLENFYFEQNGHKIDLSINAVYFSKNQLALVVALNTVELIDTNQEVYLVNTLLCDASPMQTNDIKYQEEYYSFNLSNPKQKIPLE